MDNERCIDLPCDRKVKIVDDIVKVMSLNNETEIKIRLERRWEFPKN